MKKTLWTLLLAAVLLLASACAQKAPPISLPKAETLAGVRLEYGQQTVTREGSGWMALLLEKMALAQPTRKQSVQDFPGAEEYAAVSLVHADGAETTLFVYPERGKWYIEQPYQGIYQTDQVLWQMVSDMSR